MVEMAIDMKGFCKHFTNFYYAGRTWQAFRLIKAKALVSSVNFGVPIPGKKNMSLDFSVMTQNDLKKGLGVAFMKVGHNWEWSPTLAYRVSLKFLKV
jgi:hypothetical protein